MLGDTSSSNSNGQIVAEVDGSSPSVTASQEKMGLATVVSEDKVVDAAQVDIEAGKVPPQEPVGCRTAFYTKTGFGRKLLMPPFSVLNVLIMLTCFAFFLYNAVVIIQEYARSLENPAVSLQVERELGLTYPNIMFCNTIANVNITDFSFFYNNQTCAELNGCSIYSGDMVSGQESFHCIYVVSEMLKALGPDEDFGQTIEITFNIHAADATEMDPSFGADVYFLSPKSMDQLSNDYGLPRNDPFPESSPLTYQQFFPYADGYRLVGAGVFSSISLSQQSVEVYQDPRAPYYEFTASGGVAPLNPMYGDYEDIPSDSLVFVEVSFSTIRVMNFRQQPQSFSQFFGSLGGWLGSLSDGWGILTILFFLEKFSLRMIGAKSVFWWVKPQNDLYAKYG